MNIASWQAGLAGLLHDIGKFAQRAGVQPSEQFDAELRSELRYAHALFSHDFVFAHVPSDLARHLTAPRYHHNPRNRQDLIVQLADWMASGERFAGAEDTQRVHAARDAAMSSIFDQVSLHQPRAAEQTSAYYRVNPFTLDGDALFPNAEVSGQAGSYAGVWHAFVAEARQIAQVSPAIAPYTESMLSVLRRHTSFVASATPWNWKVESRQRPDISLYDHLRVTAAIAACLECSWSDAELESLRRNFTQHEKPVARIYRGDFAGIQSFIYRITRSEADKSFADVAKCLRGRSFYVSLLGDLVSRWLLRRLDLPPTNALFVGGGRFDLLVPESAHYNTELQRAEQELNDWMFEAYFGQLSLRSVCVPVHAHDFGNLQSTYNALEAELELARYQDNRHQLKDETFFTPGMDWFDACSMTGVPLRPGEQGRSALCEMQIDLGRCLPRTCHLAFVWDTSSAEGLSQFKPLCTADFSDSPLGAKVLFLEETFDRDALGGIARSKPVSIKRIDNAAYAPVSVRNAGMSFQFVANTAPVALRRLEHPSGNVDAGDVLHFDAMADALADGTSLIGILKADVDRLGLVFSMGLAHDDLYTKPTIARVSTLSNLLDAFFCGWVNNICYEVSRQNSDASNDFYISYSGGDDLFIVGPWNAIIDLAERLHHDFQRFTACNPNLTLSAGVTFVKPHFPVQRFAVMVNVALEQSKSQGRDRITIFGKTMTWDEFDHSLKFARLLTQQVVDGEVPRGLVHDLWRIYRQHFGPAAQATSRPMWSPRLYYTLTRRLKPGVLSRIQSDVIDLIKSGNIVLPVSYCSLITRNKE